MAKPQDEGQACEPALLNVEDWGRVEITNKCYGCMTCRVLAPEIFREVKAKSLSAFQGNFTELGKVPESREEFDAVRRAIISCPVKAIRWVELPKIKQTGLPPPYEGYPKVIEDNVYYMGFSDKTTFGAAGFFVQCGHGHNIMIDPPKADPKLVEAVNRLGGVQHLLFTHKDHTGNQEGWHTATNAPRLLHIKDVLSNNKNIPLPVTKDFETLLELKPLESTTLDGVPDFRIISTPGHTEGSLMFVYKDKFLFSGDTLTYSHVTGHLHALRIECWHDWETQIKSLTHLQTFQFQWVLAGHGNWWHFETPEQARSDLQHCLSWMKQQHSGRTWLPWFLLWTKLRPKNGGVKLLLCDSLLMPQCAKEHFPNWTVPSWMISATMVLPIAIFIAARIRAK